MNLRPSASPSNDRRLPTLATFLALGGVGIREVLVSCKVQSADAWSVPIIVSGAFLGIFITIRAGRYLHGVVGLAFLACWLGLALTNDRGHRNGPDRDPSVGSTPAMKPATTNPGR